MVAVGLLGLQMYTSPVERSRAASMACEVVRVAVIEAAQTPLRTPSDRA